MFTIDLMLKRIALPVSVQRKTAEDAEALYQEILAAMRSGNSEILELSCEKVPGKKVAVFSNEITAVQIAQKSGATGGGKPPGFAALAEALAE